MSQERQKNNIFITGHTRGIGKAIFDHFEQKNWRCEGISTSSGFDVEKDFDHIIEMMHSFDHIVLNAYKQDNQLCMLKKMIDLYKTHNKKIAVITSTSGTPAGLDSSFKEQEYNWYCKNKKALIEYIEKAQQDLYYDPIQIFDICPDTVKTDMSEGLWEEFPKLDASDVADCVDMCFTKPYNVNKIVIQKYEK